MRDKVNIHIEIDPSCDEPEVIIRTAEKTEEIDRLIDAVERSMELGRDKVAVYKSDVMTKLDQRDILRVCTENRKINVYTAYDVYTVRGTLRELEGILDSHTFVRISRFEIINLKKAESFDFGISGTIKVVFEDGSTTWVARRYVKAIQDILLSS